MGKRIIGFFDKLEDRVRARLAHFPIIYAVIDGVGIVLFWRGVWLTADYLSEVVVACNPGACSSIGKIDIVWWDGPVSMLFGIAILLMTGVFVSNFIGNEIIIAGLRGEKKISERVAVEERLEVGVIGEIRGEIRKISEQLDAMEEAVGKSKHG